MEYWGAPGRGSCDPLPLKSLVLSPKGASLRTTRQYTAYSLSQLMARKGSLCLVSNGLCLTPLPLQWVFLVNSRTWDLTPTQEGSPHDEDVP